MNIEQYLIKKELSEWVFYPHRLCVTRCPSCIVKSECKTALQDFFLWDSFLKLRRAKAIEKYIELFGEEELFEEFL